MPKNTAANPQGRPPKPPPATPTAAPPAPLRHRRRPASRQDGAKSRRWPRPCRTTRTRPPSTASPTPSHPQRGATVEPPSRLATGSTLSEENGSEKTGSIAPEGLNATIEPLDRVRVDSGGQVLTTNQGVPIADNQNSLKAGLRGPALLEDFILREKTHALRPRAHSRAHRACARLRRARLLRVLRAADRSTPRPRLSRRPARSRRCSCASRRWPASAAPRTRRATCAASPSSSTPTRATGTWWATTCRCSSSRTR